jgi:hypothetical protein
MVKQAIRQRPRRRRRDASGDGPRRFCAAPDRPARGESTGTTVCRGPRACSPRLFDIAAASTAGNHATAMALYSSS